jgi:LuxR family transcriptional regulator, quorum-sensing system regulator SinR
MTSRHSYNALVNFLEEEANADPAVFFARIKEEYDLDHVIYADLTLSLEGYRAHNLLYDPNVELALQIARYGLSPLTGILQTLFSQLRPLEIAPGTRLDLDAATQAMLFSCHLIPYAIFFPLLAPVGRNAFFSVHLAREAKDWPALRRNLLRDIPSLATLFHTRQLDDSAGTASKTNEKPQIRLTPREREVLGWAAAGKSYWEISKILGISERTVRYFMANVRSKLDAVSNKQAVAEAVWRGLISGSR